VEHCFFLHSNAQKCNSAWEKKKNKENVPKLCFTVFKHEKYAVHVGFALKLTTEKT